MELDENVNFFSKNYFERTLKINVKSIKFTQGSRPGDNFTSNLHSIEIKLENTEKPIHLLLKTYPSHPTRQKFLDETNLFLKELQVYKILIPEYIKLQQQEIKNTQLLKPAIPIFVDGRADSYERENCKEYENEDALDTKEPHHELKNFILMVDARKTSGFQMVDKMIGLDYDHCKLVMTELAKLHSLSLAYKVHNKLKNLSSKFPFLEETLFVEKTELVQPLIKANFATVIKVIEETLGKQSEAMQSIKRIESRAMDVLEVFLNPNGVNEEKARNFMRIIPDACPQQGIDDPFIVASHGDCWINNILFKYENKSLNKPMEVMLVDLQLSRESCLTVDLAYFFYNSTDHILRKQHLNDLLRIYYESFLNFCKILNIKPFHGFTLENLKARFHRSKILGFVFAMTILPIILQSPEHSINLDDIKSQNGDNNEDTGNLVDLMQAMTMHKSDEDVMKVRFLGMIQELHEQGVL